MKTLELAQKLYAAYQNSPYSSIKATNYFSIYAELFGNLVDTDCTFIETGVLNGGSLFMWRSWLGPKARIIGIDLNPEATKWREHGFEIHIGDQGNPQFWQETFAKTGPFDAFLDDGGHQSFQQIVTLIEAMKYMKPESVLAVEDTLTSHMADFSHHANHSFLEYAKDSTDILSARNANLWVGQYPELRNPQVIEEFSKIYSIQFFPGIVAYRANAQLNVKPQLIWNKNPEQSAQDYRHFGSTKSASVNWPDPFNMQIVKVNGKS